MSWNYRVMRRSNASDESPEIFEIHEVYYSNACVEDGLQVEAVKGYTADAVAPVSESLDGLRWVLTEMLKALDKPVLECK